MPLRGCVELAAHRADGPWPPAGRLLPAVATALPYTAGNIAGHAGGGNRKRCGDLLGLMMSHQLTRREFLAATAGTAMLTGCATQQRSTAPARVSIVKAP